MCGTLAACADAYTAFCCTINHGANLCPDTTYVGGWWKAEGSAYCRGMPRYYVDCNGTATSRWHCRCSGSATCDKRKVACNVFRYGNCNLDIENHGTAVVCRVVTCTPPWKWDPTCTTSSFVDQPTGTQSAPCLPKAWSSPIVIKWSDLGGEGGPLGPEVLVHGRALHSLPDGDGTWGAFRGGAVYDVKWLGVFAITEPIWRVVRDVVGRGGIGYPAEDAAPLPRDEGWSQAFVNRGGGVQREDAAAVGTRSLGTYVVAGPVLSKWHALGAQDGVCGFPTSDTAPTSDGLGLSSTFAKLADGAVAYRAAIYSHPALGAHAVRDVIYEKWLALGGESSPVGLPASDEDGLGAGAHLNRFAVLDGVTVRSRGAIVATDPFGAVAVWGPIFSAWLATRGAHGPLGYPSEDQTAVPKDPGSFAAFSPLTGVTGTAGGGIVSAPGRGTWALVGVFFTAWLTDQQGPHVLGVPVADEVDQVVDAVALRSQSFVTGAVFDSAVGHACVLYGPILQQYVADGGANGSLGLPTSSVVILPSGEEQATFQHGTLTYTPAAGVGRHARSGR